MFRSNCSLSNFDRSLSDAAGDLCRSDDRGRNIIYSYSNRSKYLNVYGRPWCYCRVWAYGGLWSGTPAGRAAGKVTMQGHRETSQTHLVVATTRCPWASVDRGVTPAGGCRCCFCSWRDLARSRQLPSTCFWTNDSQAYTLRCSVSSFQWIGRPPPGLKWPHTMLRSRRVSRRSHMCNK